MVISGIRGPGQGSFRLQATQLEIRLPNGTLIAVAVELEGLGVVVTHAEEPGFVDLCRQLGLDVPRVQTVSLQSS